MDELMATTTKAAWNRLKLDWTAYEPLEARDVYTLQLLFCYDVVSGRMSPFEGIFTDEDWQGFEYVRDVKYFFSEGYNSKDTHLLAVPWLEAAMSTLASDVQPRQLPLKIGFTHREELLYLCCLLGIAHQSGWSPSLSRVDMKRKWRVSTLAPYLGHVGLEACDRNCGEVTSIRIVVNGEVRSGFLNELKQDKDGGYAVEDILEWLKKKRFQYDKVFTRVDLTFLTGNTSEQ